MTDEEKEALERIDYIQDFIIENGQYNTDVNDMEYFSKILNLIEKQSKEIEDLKLNQEILQKRYDDLVEENEKFLYDSAVYLMGVDDTKVKFEDKIKAKVKEIKDRPVKDEFITESQGKLNTIIDIESLLDEEE